MPDDRPVPRTDRPGGPSGEQRTDRPTEQRGAADGPRDFGRDGISGLVSQDRAMRARDVSRPTREDDTEAAAAVDALLARASGRRR